MADPTKLTRVPVTMMDSIPVEEATVDTVGGVKLGSLETLIAGDDEGRVVPQSLVRQLLGHELEWKRLPALGITPPNPPIMSFGNGRSMMAVWNSSTTQMFTFDNRGETMLPRTAVTALAHTAANYSPRLGVHIFMSSLTSFRWTYDGDTWTIGTTTTSPTSMGSAATCVTRNAVVLFFAANTFYRYDNATLLTTLSWSTSWNGTTAAAHNDATGTTVVLGQGTSTNGAYIMRAVNDTTTFTRTLALPFAATQVNAHKLTCGNGVFVGVVTGSNCVFWSTDDGVTWETKGLPDGLFAQDIAFGDGKFVIETPYNCNYVYVSTDGENWTTVPLPTLAYTHMGSKIAFYDGDFYLYRLNAPVGRSNITSWFLRRKASTLPAIGDPIVPSTWSSFTISTAPVIVPEGFNTLNHPGTHASYALYKNRYQLIASTSTPAGSIAVQPGDAIFVSGLSITGCSFTKTFIPPVELFWGEGGMAQGETVNITTYRNQGYTMLTYICSVPQEVGSPTGETWFSATTDPEGTSIEIDSVGNNQVIWPNAVTEGACMLDDFFGYTFFIGGSRGVGLTRIILSEGTTTSHWDSRVGYGSARQYYTPNDKRATTTDNVLTYTVDKGYNRVKFYADGQSNSDMGESCVFKINGEDREYNMLSYGSFNFEQTFDMDPNRSNTVEISFTTTDVSSLALQVDLYGTRMAVER